MKNLLAIVLFAVTPHLLTAQTATEVITKADEKMHLICLRASDKSKMCKWKFGA